MAQSKGRRHVSSEERKSDDEQAQAVQDAASLAAYIADMADELSTLARRCDMPMLSYFLTLARVEAETRARELGGYAVNRSA